ATELITSSVPHHGVYHDDFHGLREFRSGDNPRAIHWRSTARRGELILREFQQNREPTFTFVLDLFLPKPLNADSIRRVEFALSFVASLIVQRGRECRDGLMTLAASGTNVFRWEGHGTANSLEELFDGLAVIDGGPARDVEELLTEAVQR